MAKLTRQEKLFYKKLSEVPDVAKYDLHYWADFIELKCLFNKDGVYTKDDFLDCLRTNKDLQPRNYKSAEEDEDDDDEGVNGLSVAQVNDNEEKHAISCYQLLVTRGTIFKDYYPFTVSRDQRTVIKRSSINWKHRCYLFLLFCSTLKYFNEFQSIFTQCFEVFSLDVLKEIIPSQAESHLFGSGNTIISERRYTGHIYNKLCKLKDDLNESDLKVTKADFPSQDYGDTGIDFVAWLPNGDTQSHMIIYVGQAACTSNWYSKKFSSSNSALSGFISISVPIINVVFIPFSLRSSSGNWHRRGDIGDCVLIDRQRLLHHFKKKKANYINLPCDTYISQIMLRKDSVLN